MHTFGVTGAWGVRAALAALCLMIAPATELVSVERNSGHAIQPQPAAPIALRVSLSERKLHVMEGATRIKSFDVAIGKSTHPTPRGSFTIRRMIWNPSWVPPDRPWAQGLSPRGPGDPRNPMGRIKIFFREPTYYIHGTPSAGTIGQAVSHGCIRMRNEDAIELGRLIMERGGAAQPDSWFQRVLNNRSRSQEVRLSRPVTLTILR